MDGMNPEIQRQRTLISKLQSMAFHQATRTEHTEVIDDLLGIVGNYLDLLVMLEDHGLAFAKQTRKDTLNGVRESINWLVENT